MDDLKSLRDKGWTDMKSLLDDEMPVKEKKRRNLFWLFFGFGVLSFLTWMLKNPIAPNNVPDSSIEISKDPILIASAEIKRNAQQSAKDQLIAQSKKNIKLEQIDARKDNLKQEYFNNKVGIEPLKFISNTASALKNISDLESSKRHETSVLKEEVIWQSDKNDQSTRDKDDITINKLSHLSDKNLISKANIKKDERMLTDALALKAKLNELRYERNKVSRPSIKIDKTSKFKLSITPYVLAEHYRFNKQNEYNFGAGLLLEKARFSVLLGGAYGIARRLLTGNGSGSFEDVNSSSLGLDESYNYEYSFRDKSKIISKHLEVGLRYNFFKNLNAYLGYRYSSRTFDFEPDFTISYLDLENLVGAPELGLSIQHPKIDNYHSLRIGLDVSVNKFFDFFIHQNFSFFHDNTLLENDQSLDPNIINAENKIEVIHVTSDVDDVRNLSSTKFQPNQFNRLRAGIRLNF